MALVTATTVSAPLLLRSKQTVASCRKQHSRQTLCAQQGSEHDGKVCTKPRSSELKLLSTAPVVGVAAAGAVTSFLAPYVELVKAQNYPDWLIHWGHPGNMAVVLLAMGGYGSYLGWQIRTSGDQAWIAKAKDSHPKIMAGMFFFFAAGAVGGLTSLLTQGKPLLESPHALTGLAGLSLLAAQSLSPLLFQEPKLQYAAASAVSSPSSPLSSRLAFSSGSSLYRSQFARGSVASKAVRGSSSGRFSSQRGLRVVARATPSNRDSILSDAIQEPIAFLGGLFAGLLRLDLKEDPLREWVAETAEKAGVEQPQSTVVNDNDEDEGPVDIAIE
eukprot:jgi/Chlat1/3876/Chrsp26S04016